MCLSHEHRAEIFASAGFEIAGIKSLGIVSTREKTQLPEYASYRLAMEAVREFPGCDVININNPSWHVMPNIETIERDSGKIVVSGWGSEVFVALRTLKIKGPIKGFGKLLEML